MRRDYDWTATQAGNYELTNGLPKVRGGYRRAEAAKPQALSSAQLCSPHSHLNIRTVRPFTGLSIVRISAGFALQLLHVRIGLGSKLEKTSFLNSSFMVIAPVAGYLSYKVNIRSPKIQPRVLVWNEIENRLRNEFMQLGRL